MTHSTTNELKAKLDDFALLEDELAATKVDLRERDSMVRDLSRANEQLRHQVDMISKERDTLRTYARNLTARLRIVSENITSIIGESSRSAVSEVGRLKRTKILQPEPQAPEDYAPSALVDRLPSHTRPPLNEYLP